MMKVKKVIAGACSIMVALATFAMFSGETLVMAATTAQSTLSQQINAGVISTDIRNASGAVVPDPVFGMSPMTASTSSQVSTGLLGTSDRRIAVDNPGGANGGWTLALNATVPGTGTWTSGAGSYTYNGTAATGLLTVDPMVGTLSTVVGGTTGVSLGSSASFTGATPVTLIAASAAASDIWSGYVTGIGLSQSIPAGQVIGTYTLSMTQTVTAN